MNSRQEGVVVKVNTRYNVACRLSVHDSPAQVNGSKSITTVFTYRNCPDVAEISDLFDSFLAPRLTTEDTVTRNDWSMTILRDSNGHRVLQSHGTQNIWSRMHKHYSLFGAAVYALALALHRTSSLYSFSFASTMMTKTTTSTTEAALQEAVSAINDQTHSFDVTIICTTDDHQASYWMDLLEHGLLRHRKVLAVSEDWNSSGGAGNGLGTLYAFEKAAALAKIKYDGFDLREAIAQGSVAAALYHTAGKGTRMAPLPASENNNKPGVVRQLTHSYKSMFRWL